MRSRIQDYAAVLAVALLALLDSFGRGVPVAKAYAVPILFLGALELNQRRRIRKQREHAEAANRRLSTQSAMVTALLEGVVEGVAVCDREGRITEVNAAARGLVGFWLKADDPKEWAARYGLYDSSGSRLLAPEELPLMRALRGESITAMEMVVKNSERPKGGVLRVNASPIRNPETEEIIGAVAVFADITRERDLRDQLLHAQKMESVGRLAGGIAHDFNNKLCVIKMAIAQVKHNLGQGVDPADEIRLLDKVTDSCAELTKQILAFGRRQVMSPQVFQANRYLAQNVPVWRRLVEENVSLETHFSADADRIKIDPIQLDQVILNLVVNARDAMPDGGRIVLETSTRVVHVPDERLAPGSYLCISVSDTGAGIPRESLPKIFEPYFTTKASGSGFGLATIYGIVKQCGGEIWVYSEIGKGSTFKVYLPLSEEPTFILRPHESGSALPKDLRVLLVEDDPALLELLANFLRSQGVSIIAERDGSAALERMKGEGRIDLLLTDTVLPGEINGKQLAAMLKERHADLKVLYMSGYTENVIVHHGVLDSGVELISKPFAPEELAKRILGVLNAR